MSKSVTDHHLYDVLMKALATYQTQRGTLLNKTCIEAVHQVSACIRAQLGNRETRCVASQEGLYCCKYLLETLGAYQKAHPTLSARTQLETVEFLLYTLNKAVRQPGINVFTNEPCP